MPTQDAQLDAEALTPGTCRALIVHVSRRHILALSDYAPDMSRAFKRVTIDAYVRLGLSTGLGSVRVLVWFGLAVQPT